MNFIIYPLICDKVIFKKQLLYLFCLKNFKPKAKRNEE